MDPTPEIAGLDVVERLVVLAGVTGAALLLFGAFRLYRSRMTGAPQRIAPSDVGLNPEDGPGFVLFTRPACRPCKAAARVLDSVLANPGRALPVTTVDAVERSDTAVRCGVRAVPTILLVAPEGRVLRRWTRVPQSEEVGAAVDGLES